MAKEIIKIETINTDVINVATTEVITIHGVGLQGDSGNNVGVASFNGRAGIVSPELDDYQTSLITNESNVIGATSTDAFNSIQSDLDSLPGTFVTSFDGRTGAIMPALGDYETSLITNDSNVTGATSKDALNTLDAENDAQDILIQGNTDDITALDIRVTQNEADIVIIQGEQVTQDGRLDTIEAEQVVQDGRLDTIDAEQVVQNNAITAIEAEQIVQNDAITAIEDTALFEAPDSPHPVNYVWLGSQIDYDAIISYDDSTLYNVNNNLETKTALWFKTKNVSPITPTITGTVADWKAVNSDEETALGVSNPTFTYQDSSVENLVTATNFDPLDVTLLDLSGTGMIDLNIEAPDLITYNISGNADYKINESAEVPEAGSIRTLRCHSMSVGDFSNTSDLVQIETATFYSNPNLTISRVPQTNTLTQWFIFSCASLTEVTSLAGCDNLTLFRAEGCALDQTTVDNIINETDANGVSNGTLNLSGGTNSAPSGASSTALANLISKGWTVTTN